MTMLGRDDASTVAFSGDVAAALDERQYDTGYGPCLDAAASGGTVVVRDTAAGELYPSAPTPGRSASPARCPSGCRWRGRT